MEQYLETLIKIGGPIVVFVWYIVRLFIKSELREMSALMQREQMDSMKECSKDLIGRIDGKADAKQLERLFAIFEELRAQVVDVLVDVRSRERDERNNR